MTAPLLSLTQAAERLGVDRRTLSTGIREGYIPSVQVTAKTVMVPVEALEKWLSGAAGWKPSRPLNLPAVKAKAAATHRRSKRAKGNEPVSFARAQLSG